LDGRQTSGTLEKFLEAASSSGKILNGLDFPRSTPDAVSLPFATDMVAWLQTDNMPFCLPDDRYPTNAMRWGLCATAGAFHRIHNDGYGRGTYISPDSGIKIWLLGVPKNGGSYEDFADIEKYMDQYDVDDPNADLYDWVALVLQPGTTL
jgi:hypothetical protein